MNLISYLTRCLQTYQLVHGLGYVCQQKTGTAGVLHMLIYQKIVTEIGKLYSQIGST
jgi:hypothetical protein